MSSNKKDKSYKRNTRKSFSKPFPESFSEPSAPKPSFQSPSKYSSNAETQRASSRIRQSLRKYSLNKKTKAYLKKKKICTDSGACMTFGTKDLDKIRGYFDGFTKFNFAVSKKRIGEESNSGFIIEVKYERDGFISYAILKSAMSSNSDNLAYEYYIGVHFVNDLCKRFPCFLETYGLYYYDSKISWLNAQNKIYKFDLKTNLNFQPTINFKKACKNSQYISILIEHINKPFTLEKLLFNAIKKNLRDFVIFDLVYILIQVYYPLVCLQDEFTHYDLHLNNVLIYKLSDNKCVEYHFQDYHSKQPMTFRTQYLVKIIDYGRSFFFKNDNLNSDALYSKLCGYKECKKNEDHFLGCGNELGFDTFNDPHYQYYYIETKKRNKSHDLLLFSRIVHKYGWIPSTYQKSGVIVEYFGKTHNKMKQFRNPLKKDSFLKVCDDLIYEGLYGTPELESDPTDDKIRNVDDLYKRLFAIINEPEYISWNMSTYGEMECMSTFQIYGHDKDKEMVVV